MLVSQAANSAAKELKSSECPFFGAQHSFQETASVKIYNDDDVVQDVITLHLEHFFFALIVLMKIF